MYDSVLVATDGSEHSKTAVRHAVDLAETYGASLHAVFVVDTETGWVTVSKADVRDALKDLGADAAERALRDVETAATDVDVVTAALEGAPDEEILRYADERGVDLVVLGTHGRTGIERRLLGSVAERVVRGATVPVLTVGTDD